MNFTTMLETASPHGYLLAFFLTVASTAAMFLYLRRKKWL
jgi:Mg2+ and Co2+ transporter CorA